MRKFLLIIGILLIILGVFTFLFKNNPIVNKIQISSLPVVVAKTDISQGTVLTSDSVTVINIPRAYILKGAFPNSNLVIGQTTNTNIYSGEQIIDKMLEKKENNPDERIISVKINLDTAVGGDIKQNDKIDLYFKDKNNSDSTGVLIAKGVRVEEIRDGNGNLITSKNLQATTVATNQIPAYVILKTDIDTANKIYSIMNNGYFYILKYAD
jgi:Flp pilus assembly protein CpaB